MRIQWPTMGTLAAVQCADHAAAPRVRDTAQGVFTEIENELSVWTPDSPISAINRAAGTAVAHPVSPAFAEVLRATLEAAKLSDGAFNPLIGPIMQAWGFNGANSRPAAPDPAELAALRCLCDWRTLSLTPSPSPTPHSSLLTPPPPSTSPTPHSSLLTPHSPPTSLFPTNSSLSLSLPASGMRLDLGGAAKGYAVDIAWERLRAAGQTNFLVDLGGNLRAFGEAVPGRGGWRTGVRNPFSCGILATFLLRSGEAVATSGNYERFVEIDTIRYAHIMDGRTGIPVTGMAGVTVTAPNAMTADILSTTLFILGPKRGLELLRHYPGCEALWIPDTPGAVTITATPGLAARLTPIDPHDHWTLNILP